MQVFLHIGGGEGSGPDPGVCFNVELLPPAGCGSDYILGSTMMTPDDTHYDQEEAKSCPWMTRPALTLTKCDKSLM